MLTIRSKCKRCGAQYELQPGKPLTVFCETCIRRYGARLYEHEQTGLNRRYQLSKEILNAKRQKGDPLREFNILPKRTMR